MGQEWAIGLEFVGIGCWVVCFTWMYRISARQEVLLKELQAQAKKIADLSQVEHDLIKEVHPQVGEIRESVKEMAEAANADAETSAVADGKTQN